MKRTLAAALALLVALLMPGLAHGQTETDEPLAMAERFLEARVAGDVHAAASWLAPVLELQDVDGQWFIDTATAEDWLWQLGERYALEVLEPPRWLGTSVGWTERLEPRDPNARHPWGFSMTIEVSAVVREGRIVYLSGAYPPIPLRHTVAAAEREVPSASTGGSSPVVLFVGSAAGVAAAYAAVGLAPKLQRGTRR